MSRPSRGLYFSPPRGRWYVCTRDGVRTPFARIVMENIIGRPLMAEENVHHINGIPHDDRPDNLMLFPSRAAHIRYEWETKQRSRAPRMCETTLCDRKHYAKGLCHTCYMRVWRKERQRAC